MFALDQTPDDPVAGDQPDLDNNEDNHDTTPLSSDSPPGPFSSLQDVTSLAGYSSLVAVDNEPQEMEHDNASAESQAVEYDNPAVNSSHAQDQPPYAALLDDLVPVLITSASDLTQPILPLVKSTKPRQNDNSVTSEGDVTTTLAIHIVEDPSPHESSIASSQPGTINPSLLMPPTPGNDPAPFSLPTDIHEPGWMKKKGTIGYFRSVHKMGGLASLICNWYRLEEVLGFPEQVSFCFRW